MVAFVLWELRVEVPLLRLRIFRDRNFSVDNAALLLMSFVFVPYFFFASVYAQVSLAKDASEAGVYLLYFFIGFVVLAQIGGRILDRRGARPAVVLGSAMATVGFWLLANKLPDLSLSAQKSSILIAGGGVGLMLGPASTDAVNRAPSTNYSEVTGITQTVRNFGASLGLAVLGAILIERDKTNVANALARPRGSRSARRTHRLAGRFDQLGRRGERQFRGRPRDPAGDGARHQHRLSRDGGSDGGLLRADVPAVPPRARPRARRAGGRRARGGCAAGRLGGARSYALAVAADASRTPLLFDPSAFETFRFLDRELHEDGLVALRYALDEELSFTEELRLPVPRPLGAQERERAAPLLALLHWVAGVSYFKLAAPPRVEFEGEPPPAAVAALLEALYSEGLGEFAYTNRLDHLPRPSFSAGPDATRRGGCAGSAAGRAGTRAGAGGRRQGLRRGDRDRAPLRPAERAVLDRGRAPDRAHGCGGGAALADGAAAARPPAAGTERVRGAERPRPGDGDRDRRGPAVRAAERLRHRRDGQRALRLGGQPALGRRRGQPPVQQEPAGRAPARRSARGAGRARARGLDPAARVRARDRARLRPPHRLPPGVHELQHDLPPGPGAARGLLVL